MAKKQVKKPTALSRARTQATVWKAQLEATQQAHKKVSDENTRLAQTIADQRATLNKERTDSATLVQSIRHDLAAVTAERDRIMRVVDQFTSVQIVSHGANVSQSSMMQDTPAKLRATGQQRQS